MAATGQLQVITVTAQRRVENLNNVPIAISVLRGQDLDQGSFEGVTEALNMLPGVVAVATNQGGGTQIGIRGVSASGPEFNGSSPIAYYLDWVPFGLVKSAIAPDSDAYDLNRVEVLNGPQGTLYGASALNGVVRVLTNDPDLNDFELKARVLGSETEDGGGNYGGDTAINMPIIDGKLAVRAVVGYENNGGWIDGPLGNNLNNEELRNYRVKVAAQPIDPLSVNLSLWSTRDNYGAPAASSDGARISATIPEPLSTDYDAYNARIAYAGSSAIVSSMTSYLGYTNGGQLEIPGLAPPYNTVLNSIVRSEELTATSANSAPWHWFVGGFYRDATDRIQQTIPTILGTNWGDGSNSYAIFGELGRRFLDNQFEWSLGARYFHDQVYSKQNTLDFDDSDPSLLYYKKDSFKSPTPRAVLTWYPSSNLTAYISYAQGFRSGFPQYSSVAKTYPNFPAVEPDKLSNYELGSKMELLDRRLSIDTALYYMDWLHVQQTLNVPVNGTSVYVTAPVNGQSASGVGMDIALSVHPMNGLTFGLSGSWNDLELDHPVYSSGILLFDKGDRLNDSSELTGGAMIAYSVGFYGGYSGTLNASVNYISKEYQRTLNTNEVDVLSSDNLVLGRAGFSLEAPRNWTATLFVDNFTNESGAAAPPTNPIPDWTPRLRPRTVGLQFDYKY